MKTAIATRLARASPVEEFATSSMIEWVCSPMTRKTAFSRMYWIVPQLIRSAMRAGAVCTVVARWARSTPATTTARTPEEPMSSAGR